MIVIVIVVNRQNAGDGPAGQRRADNDLHTKSGRAVPGALIRPGPPWSALIHADPKGAA
ncbi:hypothetical protein ACFCXT_01375 [Streptomyces vinaceus]|uniref:hypothetical protein n=1 Tax=Streptomyces vinaceus TaxID=1960 RepID=UPI0035DA1544